MVFYKIFAIGFDHLPYASEGIPDFFFGTSGFCRIGEIMMKYFYPGRNIGTVFKCAIANGNNIIEFLSLIFAHMVGGVVGDINTVFFHGGYGPRIYTMGFDARAEYFYRIASEMLKISVGHLAPAGVTCA